MVSLSKAAALAVCLFASLTLSKITNATFFYNKTRPLVVAHRGASG